MAAAQEYGINTYTVLPDKAYQADRQVVAMDDAINTRPDGIVFAPLDTDACALPAKTAMDAGIPVTLVDTLIAGEDYIAAFMTDNRAAGKKAADHSPNSNSSRKEAGKIKNPMQCRVVVP